MSAPLLSRRWQITGFGRQHLQSAEVPVPQPGPGQILVRVEAASLNYRDLMLTDNAYGWTPPLPFVPGSDLAGTVQAVGEGVTRWHGGERVVSSFMAGWIDGVMPPEAFALGGPGPGTLASHVLLDAQWAVAAPRTLDAAQASTLPCAALTAWFALAEQGVLRAGQTVLIHGTGGVALFGLQFARMHGAQAIVVSGAQDKRERALALGASHVLARDADWPAAVRELTGGRGADQVLETVGGANLGRSLEALAQGGRLSVIGVLAGGEIRGSAYDTIRSRATLQGLSVGHRRALEDMVRAIDVNALAPVIAAEYAFDQVPEAFAHLERGAFGKVVVRF
ncbi:alcohol dehydrogenase [Acidovorax soli]|uniref:Alcohol dehydrogenase n=1 Tax=Acidovorax soli TaxID=592050 RepID=A0A7X0UAD9_9BURK|nr:NAD(P)-dependent alcohol dehydrogenase [Acidovorax soli]MBB6560804.1 alcohol dehydrogenase [Acidovorax soli]